MVMTGVAVVALVALSVARPARERIVAVEGGGQARIVAEHPHVRF